MLNERLSAALPIAKSLKGAERALNDSVRQIGALLVNIADAKDAKGTRFDLGAGVAASEKVALAAVSAIQSYQQMIAAHECLAADRDDAGLKVVSFGDLYCPSQQGALVQERPGLKAVGD